MAILLPVVSTFHLAALENGDDFIAAKRGQTLEWTWGQLDPNKHQSVSVVSVSIALFHSLNSFNHQGRVGKGSTPL